MCVWILADVLKSPTLAILHVWKRSSGAKACSLHHLNSTHCKQYSLRTSQLHACSQSQMSIRGIVLDLRTLASISHLYTHSSMHRQYDCIRGYCLQYRCSISDKAMFRIGRKTSCQNLNACFWCNRASIETRGKSFSLKKNLACRDEAAERTETRHFQ